ncbi:Uncharacterised protein [Vibrio cholerae]|nr:Uncharacterised protein [Vibrio cholerae]
MLIQCCANRAHQMVHGGKAFDIKQLRYMHATRLCHTTNIITQQIDNH